jgi:ParB family chromosome partitioning protein
MNNDLLLIPLNKLVRSSLNVRKTGADSIEDLAASILAHGLLQNLTVTKKLTPTKAKAKAKDSTDDYEVVAGGRRLAALQSLAKQKKIPKDYAVPCKIVDGNGEELSLVENTVRQPMHPADQFEAFNRLVLAGLSVEDVAARFGVTPLFVAQRLKLAHVSPTFIQLYRDGGMNLEQLQALAITDDWQAQEAVWNNSQEWLRTPAQLRRALTQASVHAADRRVVFVGFDTYLQAGGGVHRDLFDSDNQGFLTDPDLLDSLIRTKLNEEAAKLKAEGWSWVKIDYGRDYSLEVCRHKQLPPIRLPLSSEMQAECDALIQELAALEDKPGDECSEAELSRIDEITNRLEAIAEKQLVYTPEQKARSGVLIAIDAIGELSINAGLLERSALKQTVDQGEATTEPVDPDKVSGSLQEELTAQRTVAIRAELMARPDVALVAITHRLAGHFCYRSYEGVPAAVMINPIRFGLEPDLPVTVGSKADDRINAAAQSWTNRLPEKVDQLWDWLMQQPKEAVLDLLAFVVAQTIDAVQKPHQASDEAHLRGAKPLSKALALDMANWWAPTSENYFSRIKRDQILGAITEATGKPAPERLNNLKKKDLAAEAESLIAGSRWVPPAIRD